MKLLQLNAATIVSAALFLGGQEDVVVMAQPPSPEVQWTANIGQEVRAVLYYPPSNVLIVGGSFGELGASIHVVNPSSGVVSFTSTVAKSPDDVDPNLPLFLGPFHPVPGTGDTFRYLLMVINDGFDADGNSIGRIVANPPNTPNFVWETKTIGLNPAATWSNKGFASGVTTNDDGSVAYICQSDGTLSAIDTSNGGYLWQVVDETAVRMSGIAFFNGELYVSTSQVDFVGTGGLHRYEAASGAKKDFYAMPMSSGGIKTSPSVDAANGRVYVTDSELGFLRFDASVSPLAPTWSTIVAEGSSSQQTFSNVAVSPNGSNAYAPARTVVGKVLTEDGSVTWRKGYDGNVDDLVLSTVDSALYVTHGTATADSNTVDKVDTVTEAVGWRWSGSRILATPSLDTNGRNIYIGHINGDVHSILTENPSTPSPSASPTVPAATNAPTATSTTLAPIPSPTLAPVVPTGTPTAEPTSSPTPASEATTIGGMWQLSTKYIATSAAFVAFLFY